MVMSKDPNQREIAIWQNAIRTGARLKLIPIEDKTTKNNIKRCTMSGTEKNKD